VTVGRAVDGRVRNTVTVRRNPRPLAGADMSRPFGAIGLHLRARSVFACWRGRFLLVGKIHRRAVGAQLHSLHNLAALGPLINLHERNANVGTVVGDDA
jgi:hypothetical protein